MLFYRAFEKNRICLLPLIFPFGFDNIIFFVANSVKMSHVHVRTCVNNGNICTSSHTFLPFPANFVWNRYHSISLLPEWLWSEHWTVIIGHGFECLIEICKRAIFSKLLSGIVPIDFVTTHFIDTIQGDVYMDQLVW